MFLGAVTRQMFLFDSSPRNSALMPMAMRTSSLSTKMPRDS